MIEELLLPSSLTEEGETIKSFPTIIERYMKDIGDIVNRATAQSIRNIFSILLKARVTEDNAISLIVKRCGLTRDEVIQILNNERTEKCIDFENKVKMDSETVARRDVKEMFGALLDAGVSKGRAIDLIARQYDLIDLQVVRILNDDSITRGLSGEEIYVIRCEVAERKQLDQDIRISFKLILKSGATEERAIKLIAEEYALIEEEVLGILKDE